jgi:hypothetical protein
LVWIFKYPLGFRPLQMGVPLVHNGSGETLS